MDWQTILIAAALVGGTGVLIAVFLEAATKVFHVDADPRIEAIEDVLPGNNCGGCGYPGCSACAKAIVEGETSASACVVGGQPVACEVADIMGTKAAKTIRLVAVVGCSGNCYRTEKLYRYTGLRSCKSLTYMQNGGPKACTHGCAGYGDCVKVCQFDAMTIVNGVAYVDWKKCRGCGQCAEACPKHLIKLVPVINKYQIMCSSHDKGKDVMAVCENGCIACHACERACEQGAITFDNNLPVINQDKCNSCGACARACPKRVIS